MSTLFVFLLAGGLVMASASSNDNVSDFAVGLTLAVLVVMTLNAYPKLASTAYRSPPFYFNFTTFRHTLQLSNLRLLRPREFD